MDAGELKALIDAVEAEGGRVKVVALKIGGATLSNGEKRKADGQLAGSPPVLFDAVAVIVTEEGGRELARHSSAVQFAMDAFGHLKAIGCNPGAHLLLREAGIEPDAGVTALGAEFTNAAKQRFFDREPGVRAMT